MRTAPRVVECSACHTRERIAADVPGLPMDLPPQWRMVGRDRRARPILLCPACVVEAHNDTGELSTRVVEH
jgi:hypothetical protein